MITLPLNITLQDWADQICLDLGNYGIIGKIIGDDWQDWGSQLCNNTSIGNTVPNPYQFEDWQTWGQRLCEVLR